MSRQRQLARLLRALIACLAFLCAVEAPLVEGGSARDASAWVAERRSAPDAQRAVSRPSESPPIPRSASAQPSTLAARAARRDGRHLYLELQTLLC